MYSGCTVNPTSLQVNKIVSNVPKDTIPWPIKKSKFFASKYTGKGQKIAIIDTGVGLHKDINKSCIKRLTARGKKMDPSKNTHYLEHGTFCCGEICGAKDGKGIIGAAYNSKFYSIQGLCPDRGVDPFWYLTLAINKAVELKVDVINMSLGSTHDDMRVKEAVGRANRAGIIIVAAAGNAGRNGRIVRNYPSDYSEVISVGSVNINDMPSSYTQFSKSVFVSIGGENMYGILPNNRFGNLSGTSMSSPLIAAVALRWCEKHPKIKKKKRPKKFLNELKSSVTDIYKDGWDNRSGWGYLIDVPKIAMVTETNNYPQDDEGPNFILVA